MNRSRIKFGLIGVLILILVSCKKYKENILILEPPYIAIERWKNMKIQYIKVNGVDCTDYYKQKVSLFNQSFRSKFDYNATTYDYRKIYILTEDEVMVGSLILQSGFDEICKFNIGSAFPLIDPKEADWDILKLNHKEFKVKKYDNGKEYEVYMAR